MFRPRPTLPPSLVDSIPTPAYNPTHPIPVRREDVGYRHMRRRPLPVCSKVEFEEAWQREHRDGGSPLKA
jgi:hypothetical protein